MKPIEHNSKLSECVRDFVRRDFTPHFGKRPAGSMTNPRWERLREVGTHAWFDSGDAEGIGRQWSADIGALTTNNTLLNKEVQKGTYDTFIKEAAVLLKAFPELSEQERVLELAFMLNARHGLALVERFDAFVSVEEHTALAHDLEGAVRYARRYHAVCPERFIVKLPLTAAGILATRCVQAEGIPVNHTLGFSARQNYLVAQIAKPAYVNVFLGRLNSVTSENELGSGQHVGERATLASQAVIRTLRDTHGLPTKQIAASLRSGDQINALAGVDVMTIPLSAAEKFLAQATPLSEIVDCTATRYQPSFNEGADWARFDTLWSVPQTLVQCLDGLKEQDLDAFNPDNLIDALGEAGCGDLLVRWTPDQVASSAREGKIPKLKNWRALLQAKRVGLDSLMNLAGLNSFTKDQADMDQHVHSVLEGVNG